MTIVNLIGTDIQRDVKEAMFSYIPFYYSEIKESKSIIEAEALEKARSKKELQSLLDQFFIDTATTSLEVYEKILGIPISTELTIEERRSNIKAKLRSNTVVTAERIKAVASSFTGGTVEVYHAGYVKDFKKFIYIQNHRVSIKDGAINAEAFKATGADNIIYLPHQTDNNFMWRWDFVDEATKLVKVERGNTSLTPTRIREGVNKVWEVSVVEQDGEGALNTEVYSYSVAVPANTIVIEFIDKYGVPTNLTEFKRAIRELVPAHLVIQYIYRYPTWDTISTSNRNWTYINGKQLTWADSERGGIL